MEDTSSPSEQPQRVRLFTPNNSSRREMVYLFDAGRRATHSASQDFVNAIQDEIREGFGFVPFIGAGFSVSAGIPIIQQLKSYLQRCICIALGVDIDHDGSLEPGSEGTYHLWNPRTDRWPPLVDRRRPERDNWLELMEKRYKDELLPKLDSSAQYPALYLEALGAMAEWRTSLYFLSRLVPASSGKAQNQRTRKRQNVEPPSLGVPSQEVVDSCFREVMRDKHPSLNHVMLATVSGLLRIDTILTTNFDTLIESAFESSRNPLQVFDVHLRDALPEFSAVSRSRSIIKLHGTQSSLRADYSLDGEPSQEDRERFIAYLTGGTQASRILTAKNHLLLLGVGANERRTMSFIYHALQAIPDLKVFWVCYSAGEIHSIERFVANYWNEPKRSLSSRIYVLRHTEAGLLFLHTYQSIRKTLPPSDAVYPSATHLSLPPLPQSQIPYDTVASFKTFKEDLQRCIKANPLSIATAALGVTGVTSACADIFRELESGFVSIWLEMNDIHSVDELFETIQEAAYRKLGQVDWTPLYAAQDHRLRRLEIKRIADASGKPWIIFLNAREVPGSNRKKWDPKSNANGWLDDTKEATELGELLKDLCDARQDRVKVVLMCRDPHSTLAETPYRFSDRTVLLSDENGNLAVNSQVDEQLIKNVLEWAADQSKERFLHTLSLMQRSRHLSTAWSRAMRDNDSEYHSSDDTERMTWLNKLHALGLVRWKDGGFIWMHSNLRQRLRDALEIQTECRELSQRHLALATWYLKVFQATSSPPSVFEAVDHLAFRPVAF